MKKILLAALILVGFGGAAFAQSTIKKTNSNAKVHASHPVVHQGATPAQPAIPGVRPAIPATPPSVARKDGHPDMRYKSNKSHMKPYVKTKKDGTPDRRYKENK